MIYRGKVVSLQNSLSENKIEENKIVIYQTEDGETQIDVRLENETVWLSANQMAALFGRDEKTIRKHINNVFSDQEVPKDINTHFLRVIGVAHPDFSVVASTDHG